MTTLSVCFVLPIGSTLGGSNIWSARMCGHLADAGRVAALLVHTNPGWHPDGELPVRAETMRVDCFGPSVTKATEQDVEAFAARYETLLPSVVIPNWSDAAYASCARLASRRPQDVRVLGVAHGNSDWYYQTLVYYEPIISAFIAVSDEIEQALVRLLPHRRQDIFTRACAVDVQESLVRSAYGAGQPLRITYAGRLTNFEKRVSNLAPLMAEMDRLGVDFRFRIVGEGGYRATLEQEIARLPSHVQKKVRLEGLVPPAKMSAIWGETDVCVLVSDSEGTSITMLEAMAAGCVPVVTRVSGTAAVIEDGVNGYIVEVEDMTAMARRISEIAADRGRMASMGAAAHRKALERYSYRSYVPWFLDLIERVESAPDRPWPVGKPFLRVAITQDSGLKRVWRRLFGGSNGVSE